MKLKTKLIPLASVAAVTATAIPITLTSCGLNDDYIDLLTRYVPEGKQLDIANLTLDQASRKYFEDASANPEIIRQDYLWYASNSVIQVGKDNAKYHLLKVSDVACEGYAYENQVIPLISFTLDFKYDYTLPIDYSTTVNQVYIGKSVYRKVPFMLDYDVVNNLWRFSWIELALFNSKFSQKVDWSIDVAYTQDNIYYVSDSIYGNYISTKHYANSYGYNSQQLVTQTLTDDDKARIISALGEDGMFYSWYLYNIICMGGK